MNNIVALTQKVVVIFILLSIQACGSQPVYQAQMYEEKQKLTGHYIYGHEVNSFQPCGKKQVYWVTGSNKNLQLLEQSYKKYTTKPYAEVYLELTGNFIDKASDGFAMDYDGQIIVIKIIEMKRKSKMDCK